MAFSIFSLSLSFCKKMYDSLWLTDSLALLYKMAHNPHFVKSNIFTHMNIYMYNHYAIHIYILNTYAKLLYSTQQLHTATYRTSISNCLIQKDEGCDSTISMATTTHTATPYCVQNNNIWLYFSHCRYTIVECYALWGEQKRQGQLHFILFKHQKQHI